MLPLFPQSTNSHNGKIMCENRTENEPHNTVQDFRHVMFISISVYSSVFGTIINFSSFVALISCRALRSKAITILIFNMCASDFFYCSVTIPLHLANYLYPIWLHRQGDFSAISYYLRYIPAAVDWSTISLIALERYFRICRSLHHGVVFSVKNSYLYIIFIWLIPFLICGASFLEFIDKLFMTCHHSTYGHYICKPMDSGTFAYIGYTILPSYTNFGIIVFSYVAIYMKLSEAQRWRSKNRQGLPPWVSTGETEVMKTSFIVVMLYMICVLPLPMLNVFDECGKRRNFRMFFRCLYMQVYYVNNLVYMLRIPGYRNACLKLFRKLMWK